MNVFKESGAGGVFGMFKDLKGMKVKLDMKMKVKIWGMTFTIPYIYEDTMQGFMGTSPENKSTENKEAEC